MKYPNTVNIIVILFLFLLGMNTAFAQISPKDGAEKKRTRIQAMAKPKDSALVVMQGEVLKQFKTLRFIDPHSGKEMTYNLFVPRDYDKGKHYPLVLFMADASTVGGDSSAPLTQGYGGIVWASKESQSAYPAFVLVPSYKSATVNDQFEVTDEVEMTIELLRSVMKDYNIDSTRLYCTGQSMGGMMSMYLNISHPNLFAASIYVSCQWDTERMKIFASDKFFYIVAAGDEKASKGMAALRSILEREHAGLSALEWSARLPKAVQEDKVKNMLSANHTINLITFTKGSVLPADGSGMEHMASFDYAYKIKAVRDWLFQQRR